MTGALKVKVQHGKDLKDVEVIGNSDPYVILQVGSHKLKTKTHKDAGSNPVWNQILEFNIASETQLGIKVMDDNSLSTDELMGEGILDLSQVLAQQTQSAVVHLTTKKGKKQGTLTLELQYVAGGVASAPAPGTAVEEGAEWSNAAKVAAGVGAAGLVAGAVYGGVSYYKYNQEEQEREGTAHKQQ